MEKFEEYKFFTERVERHSERRQQASQNYLTINTAVFGIIVLVLKDSGLHGWNLVVGASPLFLVGIIISSVWLKIIFDYKKMIDWHYEQLREMEKEIPGSFQMHTREWEEFFNPAKPRKGQVGFSHLEAWMPLLFTAIYIIYLIGLAAGVNNGLF